MGTFSKLNYESISVDLAAMSKLSQKLRTDGEKLKSLFDKLNEDIRQLGYEWEDENYSRFLLYYLDREDKMRYFQQFPIDQAEWVAGAVSEYGGLPDEIQAKLTANIREDF